MHLHLKALEGLSQRFSELFSENRTQHCMESSSLTLFVLFTQQPPDFTAVTHRCVPSLLQSSVFHEHRQHAVQLCVDLSVTWRCGQIQRFYLALSVFHQDDRAIAGCTCICSKRERPVGPFVLSPSNAAGCLTNLVSITNSIKILLWGGVAVLASRRRESLGQIDVLRRKLHQLILQSVHVC